MSIPEGVETVVFQGKAYPLFGSVLLYAQQKCHLRSLEVQLVQAPTAENGQMAICAATATFAPPDGEVQVYTDIGDASPASLKPNMVQHTCRLAATRAKGRAVRDGCGITTALYEEMGEEQVADGQPAGDSRPMGHSPATVPPDQPQRRPQNGQQGGSGKFCQFEGCGVEVYPGEFKESYDSFKRIFCATHREEMRRKLATRPAV